MIVLGDAVDGLDIKQSCDEIALKTNKRNGDDARISSLQFQSSIPLTCLENGFK